ncbi:MAG: hypothetical protein JEZ07_13025 [Phycisphaerae bacterium]|nr:hypothetical protein [Phycisphaerae bacterium]
MKKLSVRFYSVLFLFLIVNISGILWIQHELTKGPELSVRLKSFTPVNNAEFSDRLAVVFDREMISVQELSAGGGEALFDIKPVWPGKWQWAALDKVEYILDKPLPTGRVFKVIARDEFAELTGRELEGKKGFEIRTGELQIVNCFTESVGMDSLTAKLMFTQEVIPGELLRNLKVRDVESDVYLKQVMCLTKEASKQITVQVTGEMSRNIQIRVDKSLVCDGGELSMARDMVFDLKLPKAFGFLNGYAYQPRLNEACVAYIKFSRKLLVDQMFDGIKIIPAIDDLTVSLRSYDHSKMKLQGSFKAGQKYKVQLPGTLTAVDDEILGDDLEIEIDVPEYDSAVDFDNDSGFLSPDGNLQLGLKIVNADKIECQGYKVLPGNLVEHLHDYSCWPDEVGRKLFSKELVVGAANRNEVCDAVLDLKALGCDKPGIYYFDMEIPGSWYDDQALVVVTDLAITVKKHKKGAMVWVTSLRTGKAMEGVKIVGLTYNNQRLGVAVTDNDGIAKMSFSSEGKDGGLWLVTASKGEDLSYIEVDDNQWMVDSNEFVGRYDVGGYDVKLYGERGVYRSGDIVHLTGVMRKSDGSIPKAFAMEMKVYRPDGRQVKKEMLKGWDNGQGVFHVDYASPAKGQTGRYSFKLSIPGSDKVIGSCEVLMEAFVPVRIEVAASAEKERFGPEEKVLLDIQANYLWDNPAANLSMVLSGFVYPKNYVSGSFKEFSFGRLDSAETVGLAEVKDKLDVEGEKQLEIKLPEKCGKGFYVVDAFATVTEAGGRSVSDGKRLTIDTLNCHTGLFLPDGKVVRVGQDIKVLWQQVDGLDTVLKPEALKMTLERIEYDSVVKYVDGRRIWRSTEKNVAVDVRQLDVDSDEFVVKCTVNGRYKLKLIDEKNDSAAEILFYASNYADGTDSLAMNQPELLEILTDKECYEPGGMASVVVRSPIAGKLLFTVEADHVMKQYLVDIKDNSVTLDVEIPDEARGSVYLCGSVVSGIDPANKKWLPCRAMGVKQIQLDHDDRMITVKLITSGDAKPGENLEVAVDVGKISDAKNPAMVHLWAVDDGILLCSKYRVPDLLKHFLSPRKQAVFTSDLFYRLLPDMQRPTGMMRIGSGGNVGDDIELRSSPVEIKSDTTTIIWRKAIAVDADGKANFKMKMPDMVGRMRLMAVAVDHDRYGLGQKALELKRDVMMQVQLPRFACLGDEFKVPVKIFNNTDANVGLLLSGMIWGGIGAPELSKSINVPANGTVTHWIDVRVNNLEKGKVELMLSYSKGGVIMQVVKDLPVRSASSLHCEVELKTIKAGDALIIEPAANFVDGTVRTEVSVSAASAVHLKAAAESLLDYPYGCAEQTASRLYGLLHAGVILQDGRQDVIDEMVRAGIARLWSMQTLSGGIAYWPGGVYPNGWASIYAGSVLLEAEAMGYELDDEFKKNLFGALGKMLDKEVCDIYLNLNETAFVCRVLAQNDMVRHGWMNRLVERKDELDVEGRAQLAWAFYAIGRKDRALAIIDRDYTDINVKVCSSERFTSNIRQLAVWLRVMLEIAPDDGLVAVLADKLNKMSQQGRWYNTLENATALGALSLYQQKINNKTAEFIGLVRGDNGLGQLCFSDQKGFTWQNKYDGAVYVELAGKGTGFVCVKRQGLAKAGLVEPYSHGIEIARRWLKSDGSAVETGKLKVGDLVQVEVEIRCAGGFANNIAIVDLLAAGMEVENPRLATSAVSSNQSDDADHVEFGDDRVILFCGARDKRQVFCYALRVTTVGEFVLPSLQASSMYDAEVGALGAESKIVVVE